MMPDVTAVVNGWQALVLIALLLAPQIAAWRSSRQARSHARDASEVIRHESQPNSGSSMKDSLNRIESRQVEHGAQLAGVIDRVATLERAAEKRGRLRWR